MYPSQHLFLGILFGVLLFSIWSNYFGISGMIIVIASSVLIDVDHYLYIAIKKKQFNFFKVKKWFPVAKKKLFELNSERRNNAYTGWWFLHGVEFMSIFLLLGLFLSKYFLFVFYGLFFHHILDYLHEHDYHYDRYDKISSIYDFLKFRKMEFIDD